MAAFGKAALDDFLLSKDYLFLNHGSYGAVPKRVHEAKARMQVDFETVPDRWFRRQYWDIYKDNIEAAADFLGTDPNNIVFTRNTTAAISTVMRHLSLGPGDKILINSWTYGSMKAVVKWVTQNTGAEFVLVNIRVPLDRQKLIQSFQDAIEEHKGSIKFAIIDYISSVPPVLMPWRELSTLCLEHNIQVLIDGAHTPGQVELKLDNMGVHYYVGNLHKWAYTHRGCAALYVNPKLASRPVPLAVSGAVQDADWRKGFYYQGTDDCTTYCIVKEAISYIKHKGGLNSIIKYNQELVTEAASMLAERWGTRILDISEELEAPNMRMVRLPDLPKYPPTKEVEGNIKTLYCDMKELMELFMDRYKIVALFVSMQSEPYVRISANIYNTLDDYIRLAETILALKEEN